MGKVFVEIWGRGRTGAAVAVLRRDACCAARGLLAAGAVGGCVAGWFDGVVGVVFHFCSEIRC